MIFASKDVRVWMRDCSQGCKLEVTGGAFKVKLLQSISFWLGVFVLATFAQFSFSYIIDDTCSVGDVTSGTAAVLACSGLITDPTNTAHLDANDVSWNDDGSHHNNNAFVTGLDDGMFGYSDWTSVAPECADPDDSLACGPVGLYSLFYDESVPEWSFDLGAEIVGNYMLIFKQGNVNSGGGMYAYLFGGATGAQLGGWDLFNVNNDLSHISLYLRERTNVPTPGTLALLVIGLVGLTFTRGKK